MTLSIVTTFFDNRIMAHAYSLSSLLLIKETRERDRNFGRNLFLAIVLRNQYVPASMFPTCVGLNRILCMRCSLPFNVPHMRGAEPVKGLKKLFRCACSPHAWG